MTPVKSLQSTKPSQNNTSLYSHEGERTTKMAAPICDDEDYFSRPNKYKFNDVIGMISAKNGINIRTFQKQRLRPGHWVDTRRFLSKTKRELANGLFEVFGDFSNEPANLVRDNLMGWIYNNFHDVGRWTKLMLKEKEQTLGMDRTHSKRNYPW